MELTYASGKDLENGWLLSVKFLKSIQESMETRFKDDELPSLEQIEGTLIAFQLKFKEPKIRLVHVMRDDKDTY